jgi:hypothetical protein
MFPHITDFRPAILMPPKSTYTKNPKKRAALDKARRARLSCGQGHSAKPFSASADDEYVHSGSSLSDAESAEAERGDTSPGNIIYTNVIFCVTRIGYSSSTATPTKEYSCWEVHPSVESIRNRQSSNSSSGCPAHCCPVALDRYE